MNTTSTAPRMHPLMAIAAASVIVVSLAGTAAITGLLPHSNATVQPQTAPLAMAPAGAAAATPAQYAAMAAQPLAAPVTQQYALVPVQSVATPVQEPAPSRPVVRKVVHHPRVVEHHYTQVARNDERGYYQSAPAPQPRQPNYLGIGAGALIGGLVGNQVGGGNGKKLATVAGVIGGGMLGNEIANRNGYGR